MSEQLGEIVTGDRVRYRVGRGHGEGRVVNVALDLITIETAVGKLVNRKRSAVEYLPGRTPPNPTGV